MGLVPLGDGIPRALAGPPAAGRPVNLGLIRLGREGHPGQYAGANQNGEAARKSRTP